MYKYDTVSYGIPVLLNVTSWPIIAPFGFSYHISIPRRLRTRCKRSSETSTFLKPELQVAIDRLEERRRTARQGESRAAYGEDGLRGTTATALYVSRYEPMGNERSAQEFKAFRGQGRWY